MLRKTKKSVVALGVLAALSISPSVFAADTFCTTGSSTTAKINGDVNFSVSARGSYTPGSRTVPVRVYYSSDNKRGGHDVLLASTSVTSSQGACSSIKQIYTTMTANSTGLGCFTPGQQGYYLFETANDLRTAGVALSGSYPEITSVSPSAAQPGMPIRIYGSNFTSANTAVFFGNVQANRAVLSDGEIYAIVPQGASSSHVEVRHYENGGQFCVPPLSTSSFSVQPATCSSTAQYTGYGNIASFGGQNASSCANYSNKMDSVLPNAAKGTTVSVPFSLGTCGQAEYNKLLKVYIDWNQNSSFSETDELMLSASAISANTNYNLNIAVPQTASVGLVKARMIMALYYNGVVNTPSDISACGTYPFGETLDFTIQVVQNSQGVMVAEIADKEAFATAIEAFNEKAAEKGALLSKELPMLGSDVTDLVDAEVPSLEGIKLGFPSQGPQERIVERQD